MKKSIICLCFVIFSLIFVPFCFAQYEYDENAIIDPADWASRTSKPSEPVVTAVPDEPVVTAAVPEVTTPEVAAPEADDLSTTVAASAAAAAESAAVAASAAAAAADSAAEAKSAAESAVTAASTAAANVPPPAPPSAPPQKTQPPVRTTVPAVTLVFPQAVPQTAQPASPPPINVIPKMPDPYSGGIYRVQVGSFSNTGLAQQCFQRLQSAGFSPYYEPYNDMNRVLIIGIKAADMEWVIQRLAAAGFSEVWVREER